MTTQHSLHLLGGTVVRGPSGEPADALTARRHPVALLALLATAPGGAMSRGKVAGLLWPDVPERKARRRLNSCVHRVRTELGESALVSIGDELRLNADLVDCDVHRFERALEEEDHERAVALYEGPLLEGFYLKGASGFEKRMEEVRDRYRRQYHDALETLAAAAEDGGEPAAAVRWWRERARASPYDSRVTRRLMQALDSAGNPAAALQVAEEHALRLDRDLGIQPSANVRELAERIRAEPPAGNGGPERRRGSQEPAARPDSPPLPGVSGGSAPSAQPAGGEAHSDHRSEEARRPFGRPTMVAAALVVLGIVATAVWHLAPGGASTGVEERSVAVLPLDDLSSEGDKPFLAAAMTEEITSALSQIPELRVASRNSASKFPDSRASVPDFARELGVSHVIEGSVQRVGERVRISVQLIDARADRHVWAETYERELTDLFQVQVDVARHVADRLAASFTERERDRILAGSTGDPVAYGLYLQDSGTRQAALDDRIEQLREAVRRDSAFWPAWQRLAVLYLEKDEHGHGSGWADSSRAAFRRAIAHADSSAAVRLEAREALTFGGDEEEKIARLRAAVERNPSDVSLATALGRLLRLRGQLPEAARWLRHAASLDPLQPGRWQALFPGYWWAGLYGPAERVLRREVELDRGRPWLWIQFSLQWMIQGRFEEALAAADTARELGGPHRYLDGGFVHWWSGDMEAAAAIFSRFDPADISEIPLYLPSPMAHALYATGDSAAADAIVAGFRAVLDSQGADAFDPEWRVFPRLQLAALEDNRARAVELFRLYVERGGRDPTWYVQSPLFARLRNHAEFRSELNELQRRVDAMRREMERDLSAADERFR